jgi:hypothetical protein
MREYRAAKKVAHERYDEAKPLIGHLKTRVGELEDEVRHLKAELAKRPALLDELDRLQTGPNPLREIQRATERFNTQPFTGPIPKVRK